MVRMTKSTKQISMPPLPSALIESLRNIGYTIDTALADIIDNSITAEATTISVRFLWEDGAPWVAIADNGWGMGENELQNAMRFGSRSPLVARGKNDLGRFGLGMKTASISQCRSMTVCSKKRGLISACEWNLDQITDELTDGWMLGVIDPKSIFKDPCLIMLVNNFLDDSDSGTIVLWRNLDTTLAGTETVDSEKKFSELMDNARRHLETIFHRFLSPDPGFKKIRMDFNYSKYLLRGAVKVSERKWKKGLYLGWGCYGV